MNKENQALIKQFQETLIAPMQDILQNRQYKIWKQDELSCTLEEIICSIVVEPKENGFTLEYCCFGDKTNASSNGSLTHMIRCLHEILLYLELYHSQGGLLPIDSKLRHFEAGIKDLLKIINHDKDRISKLSCAI